MKRQRFFETAKFFEMSEFFLKWQAFMEASGVNLQMTIPQAKVVGKWQVFFQWADNFWNGTEFSKRRSFSKGAEFFQSRKVF